MSTLGLTDQSPQGSDVGVAVIDSGISASSDFDGRISAFYDFTLRLSGGRLEFEVRAPADAAPLLAELFG